MRSIINNNSNQNLLLTVAAVGKLRSHIPNSRVPIVARQAHALVHSTTAKPNRHHHPHIFKMASIEDHHQDLADRAADSSSKRGGGGPRGPKPGGGRGGHGGRKGGRDVDLSRALSRLLRHQASSAGITLDAEGYAPLDKVLAWGPIRSLKPMFEEILKAVRESDKQRFAIKLKEGGDGDVEAAEKRGDPKEWVIRANQGHSIKLESEGLLRRLVLPGHEAKEGEEGAGTVPVPETVVHGTYFAFWEKIIASGGLKPMGRNHVHFSTGLPEEKEGGVISGMRSDAEVLVFVDVERSIKEDSGIKWWMSDNGVVLTEGDKDGLVPLKYFEEVRGRRQGVGLLWKDGEKVADLPEGLEVRMPMGKGRAGGGGRGGRGGHGRGGGRGGKGGRGNREEKKGDEVKP
ncbi:KptA family-domain-containing protein [Sordaria brevicollis]|uniref:2'-phosphotransferase n=1 Tax=Sordaria brevicollis TaxID=83679 RepID=A0AAE0PK14_SORBR|nr:KptA family-domain-containing protein [Sordaria brevicollis]